MRRPAVAPRVFALTLALFAGSIAFSLIGMVLIRLVPSVAALAGPTLPWLMKVPTWIYMLTLPTIAVMLHLSALGWWRTIFLLVWGSFIGMMAELIGTATGYPFGDYSYTAFLDPKILDHVPALIPLSWYAVAALALDLAARLPLSRGQRLLAAATFMVLWDVALDPAMGAAFPVWTWAADGFYYGMPALNWVGWYVTALVIVWGYEILGDFRLTEPPRHTATIWLINGAFPVGICIVYGLFGAAIIGAVAIVLPLLALESHRAAPTAVG